MKRRLAIVKRERVVAFDDAIAIANIVKKRFCGFGCVVQNPHTLRGIYRFINK